MEIAVGLYVCFNIAKAVFKLAGRIQKAYAGTKRRASEGFCIHRALYKRLSRVQID